MIVFHNTKPLLNQSLNLIKNIKSLKQLKICKKYSICIQATRKQNKKLSNKLVSY